MKITRTGLLLLFFLVATDLLYGQFSQPYLRKIGKNEGLTGSLVLSMVQDSRNLYWIGTLNGLQSFDGKTFKKYPLPFIENGLPGSNSISFLLVENDSILWVAHYQGIARFNLYTHTYKYIDLPKESPAQTLAFNSVFKDNEGNIWASSFELGLIRYVPEKNRFEKRGDESFHLLKRIKGPLNAGKGRLLVFHKKGCGVFDIKKNGFLDEKSVPPAFSWVNQDCFKGEIYDLFDDKEYVYALIWNFEKVAYDFIRFDKRTSKHTICNIKSVAGRRFFKDSDNNIWAYGDGVDVILAGSGEVVPIKENLKEGKLIDFTMCQRMFEDKEHNVWMCTNAGLYVFNINDHKLKICNDLDEKGYVKHTYNCLRERADGTVWAGTFGEGLLILDKDLKLTNAVDFQKKTNDPHFNLLWSIHETRDEKEVWLGCQKGRLICYDNASGKYSFYNDSAFAQQTLMCMAEDDKGNLYFGTNGGAVISKKKSAPGFTRVYESEWQQSRTAAGTVTSLSCIEDYLLIGTNYDGIIRLNINTGAKEYYRTSFSDPDALKSNNVFCLLPVGNRGYFAGTSNGLGYYDYKEKKFDFYTLYDGLPFSNVYDLVNVGDDNMLAVTSDGLYRINWDLKSFERIGKNANLYKGFNAVCLRKNGKELLLGEDEYLYNLPLGGEQRKELPSSYIYTVSSFGTSYFLKEKKEPFLFDKNHNTINIEFGASTFKYYNSIDYYYMLDGIDQDWLPAGSNRVVTYNNLKGGEYTFRLKCVFQEDKNRTQELKADFIIAKPFYQTIWFYPLLIFLACLLFYLLYRIRVNKLLAIEKIRFDLSRDLHDDMGSTLSTINILSVMAEEKIYKDSSVSKEYLKRINRISEEMMESMSDIIWSINPVNDTMEKVVVRMREFAAGILEPLNISLFFEAENAINSIEVKMKWRRDFFLIFKEAINNSAKYSDCKNMKIQISITNKKLLLCITDDGIGFNVEEQSTGNGLANMKKRAEEMGADLRIESKTGIGTRVLLLIPLNKL